MVGGRDWHPVKGLLVEPSLPKGARGHCWRSSQAVAEGQQPPACKCRRHGVEASTTDHERLKAWGLA